MLVQKSVGGIKDKKKTRGRNSLSKKLHKKQSRKDAIATVSCVHVCMCVSV